MERQPVKPHILLDGRPRLTAGLLREWRDGEPPLVLTANRAVWDREDLPTWRLRFLEMRKTEDEHGALESFGTLLKAARKELPLGDEPLRIVSTGSAGSLWLRDHAPVGRRGGHLEARPFISYMADALQERDFVEDLYSILCEQFEVRFLAEAFPRLTPPPAPPPLIGLGALAREHLAHRRALVRLWGSVPLIYVRDEEGNWRLFEECFKAELAATDAKGSHGPKRTTTRLIDQFGDLVRGRSRPPREAVLVKVIRGDPPRRNPLDNPIISLQQLQQAKQAGIDTVLLDAEFGVCHGDDEDPATRPRLGENGAPERDDPAADCYGA